jgi:hypothetical protein
MSRPRIPTGGYGEIAFINRAKGKVEARTRFGDWDGQTRLVQATAASRSGAEVALKKKLTQRNAFQPIDTTLTPDSPFPALVGRGARRVRTRTASSARSLRSCSALQPGSARCSRSVAAT